MTSDDLPLTQGTETYKAPRQLTYVQRKLE
jgi:hypothetical protein